MKNKNDAFWLDTAEFLKETADMSDTDTGTFITLLVEQCQRGHLLEGDFKKHKASIVVRDKFSRDDEGRYYSKNDRVVKIATEIEC